MQSRNSNLCSLTTNNILCNTNSKQRFICDKHRSADASAQSVHAFHSTLRGSLDTVDYISEKRSTFKALLRFAETQANQRFHYSHNIK